MRRVLFTGLGLGLVGAAVVAVAQPPTPPTAAPLTPAPAAAPATPPASPTTQAAPPLARFQPFSAFPHETQAAVGAVVTGADWLARRNQPQGRFLFGYNPALRQPLMGDHDLKQGRAALALAQAAKFTGDEKQATLAAQSILALLAATKVDPADPNCRVPVHPPMVCNRVGFAATLAVAIYELPAADAKLVAEAEKLCEFLRRQCKPDGSVAFADGPADAEGANEYPGMALHALVVSNRVKPEATKAEAIRKGIAFYQTAFRARPHPLLAATLTPACAELYLQTKSPDAAAAVYELNDWLSALQIPGTDPRVPQWAGGFRAVANGQQTDSPPGPETGLYVQSLAYACQLTRLTPDLARFEKYKAAVADATRFLTTLQYTETNTRHFEHTFRVGMLIGGFYLSPADGNLRIDATGTAVTGLLRFLASGAEK